MTLEPVDATRQENDLAVKSVLISENQTAFPGCARQTGFVRYGTPPGML